MDGQDPSRARREPTFFADQDERNAAWDKRFLDLCRLVATWSKDPSTKTASVIVRPDRTVASLGYNGFPRGCDDDPELYADRPTKYLRVVHGEANAILAARERLDGYTLYSVALPKNHGICASCATLIIQAGITRVVTIDEGVTDRWEDETNQGERLFAEAGVVLSVVPR